MDINRIDVHNHTRFSNLRFRDALPKPEHLIDKAIELGLKGIAITDHEVLSAHPFANFYAEEVKKTNPDFKVILGNEIYLVDERPTNKHYHFILLAKDKIGHRQLRRLSTIAWLNSYTVSRLARPDLLKSELEMVVKSEPGHLIASTACLGGELGSRIVTLSAAEAAGNADVANEQHDKIVDFILWCKNLFKDDFYLEVQPGTSKEQIIMNQRMLSIASCFDVKMIPTSDTHYLRPEDRYIHKAYLNSEKKEREVDAFYQSTFLHSNEEMMEEFSVAGYDRLFVEQMFNNTMEIYDKIEDYSLRHAQQICKVKIPETPKKVCMLNSNKYPNLCQMFSSDDETERYWVQKTVSELENKNLINEIHLSELEEEADVKKIIGKRLNTNMFRYPIVLSNYIDLIWDCGSTVGVGRGSACSALNHYLLGITQLNPITWEFPFFRYMNRDTDGLGDIDIDVCSSKVQTIIERIRSERSENFTVDLTEIERKNLGANYVCNFGTEASRSAVLTCARGYRSEEYPDGINNDIAQELSSLIPSERGNNWSIRDVYYGNKEKDRKPVKLFVDIVNEYPGLLDVMLNIEGMISKRGRHASGVLFLDEDPYEFNAFMRTPKGEVVTQYDLHAAEACGSTKFDILVTGVQDKITETIKLLKEDGVVDKNKSLKEIYEEYLHPDVLPLDDKEVWSVIQKAETLDLFQLDSPIGRTGARKVKPDNMLELSSVNGLIRLMTAEKGAETYLEKYVRFKNNPSELSAELDKYNLTESEKKVLSKYVKHTCGIGISQEQLMRVCMDEELCGFSLKEANKARKIVSKKKMSEIPALKEQVFSRAKNINIARYIWDYIVGPQLGYGFSDIHSVSYSFVGFQTAYITVKWNPIYWNTACLAVNSDSLEEDDDDEELETTTEEDDKVKKTNKKDYGKIANAIGNIKAHGIKLSLVDINRSSFGFKPDVENNQILFGLKGVTGINEDSVEKIVSNRPYVSLADFINKCKLKRPAMISLIKAGAFDKLDDWADRDICGLEKRQKILAYYLYLISDKKDNLTLSNFAGLVTSGLICKDELVDEKAVYAINKELKKNPIFDKFYNVSEDIYEYAKKYTELNFYYTDGIFAAVEQKQWDKFYESKMDNVREWISERKEVLLKKMNQMSFCELWNQYCGENNLSAWEMESLCFYYNKHELADVDKSKYGISNFEDIPDRDVSYYFKRKNIDIPIYNIYRIVGTVIGKNDTRHSITLLTENSVIPVVFTNEYYAMFKKRISEVGVDGKKKVIEDGWFKKGTRIMIQGYRRDDSFVAKTYKKTYGHQLYKIITVSKDGRDIELTHNRKGEFEDD